MYSASYAQRLWEIDTLRGLAVVAMIYFHFMWNLQYFGLSAVDVFSTPWQSFARGIGTSFTFLLGLSLTLSDARMRRQGRNSLAYALRRGALVFGLGMLVTLATYLLFGATYVRFGILHLLGASIILAQPFLRTPPLVALLAGLLTIAAGIAINNTIVAHPWLIWVGVEQAGVAMVDYYPLLPWFGVALLGVAAGQTLYPQGQRQFTLPNLGTLAPVQALRFLGRHSLLIYLVHQPLIIGAMLALGLGS